MPGQLAAELHADWAWAFGNSTRCATGYSPGAQSGRRALANLALAMLVPARRAHKGESVSGRAAPTSASRTPAT
jgi:aminopeptidase N